MNKYLELLTSKDEFLLDDFKELWDKVEEDSSIPETVKDALVDCVKVVPNKLIASIDYSALEDRVMANLSKDKNKLALFTEGLDGHSLSATYYFPEQVSALIGEYTDNKEASVKLKTLVDEGNKKAKEIRQNAKPISFGLSYGAFPKKVKDTIKCSIEEAEAIFDSYHHEMYPGITEYREGYVLETAKEKGYVHLGLGFKIYTDNPERDIRTLNNATCQFWSILTILAINELHRRIDKAGLSEDIKVTSTIYDSIYFEITEDEEIVKWLNDSIVEIMVKDFMEGQIVHNEANLEIGYSWANLIEIPNNASIDTIKNILKQIKEKSNE